MAAAAAWLAVGALWWYNTAPAYVYMECVDTFAQRVFTTDRSVIEVAATGASYILHRNDGDMTVIPMSPNIVCNLSREYPAHLPETAQNASQN